MPGGIGLRLAELEIIENLLPACVSGSHIAATPVAVTFFIFLALFTVLLAAELAIMLRQIKIGPNE